jgi:outer membrane protein assembly factor BamB
MKLDILFAIILLSPVTFADWPQASGPNSSFSATEPAPTSWSVVRNENIVWRVTKRETGQSTPVIVGENLFYSTMAEVEADSKIGSDTIAFCADAKTGKTRWSRPIKATYMSKLSGCFGDHSAPPAVCDGERVVFVNSGGAIHCFDLDGNEMWKKTDSLSVARGLPFHLDGKLIYTRQGYPPDENGRFDVKGTLPKEKWTQLQALDMKTGQEIWLSDCGVNMGNAVMPQQLNDGTQVAVVGRGGGHNPPEKPLGISMIDLASGKTRWTLPLDGFAATQSYRVRDNKVHVFNRGNMVTVDAISGKVEGTVSQTDNVSVCKRIDDVYSTVTETIAPSKSRTVTQTSNLLVGRYHFFRHYKLPYLGRIDVETGAVEYLELPTQLVRVAGKDDRLAWFKPAPAQPKTEGKKGKKDKGPKVEKASLIPNDMKNSRGHVVMGDNRSTGSGWGHIAAVTPTVAGDNLYLPVMSGTVYVIKWNAEKMDNKAVIAINDLGPAGESYCRAGLSISNGRIYTQTIKELICIGM